MDIQRKHTLFINTVRMARDVLESNMGLGYEALILFENIIRVAQREGLSRPLVEAAWTTANELVSSTRTAKPWLPHKAQRALMNAHEGIVCTDGMGRPWVTRTE